MTVTVAGTDESAAITRYTSRALKLSSSLPPAARAVAYSGSKSKVPETAKWSLGSVSGNAYWWLPAWAPMDDSKVRARSVPRYVSWVWLSTKGGGASDVAALGRADFPASARRLRISCSDWR